jgi:hypothetical protein
MSYKSAIYQINEQITAGGGGGGTITSVKIVDLAAFPLTDAATSASTTIATFTPTATGTARLSLCFVLAAPPPGGTAIYCNVDVPTTQSVVFVTENNPAGVDGDAKFNTSWIFPVTANTVYEVNCTCGVAAGTTITDGTCVFEML